MSLLKIFTAPLVTLVGNLDAAILARSVANAREGATDTSLRSLAHLALREEREAHDAISFSPSA